MFREIFEKFTDMGKLSQEELTKGQKLDKNDTDNFKLVDGRVFYKAISQIRTNDIARDDKGKGLETLTVYEVQEYKKMRCFLGKNNSSGYCIKGKSELVSVFSSLGSSAGVLMEHAIKQGAKHLDCYATLKNGKVQGDLYKLYSKFGFKIDKNMTTGELGVPYTAQNGISRFVNQAEKVEIDNPTVVVYMKR